MASIKQKSAVPPPPHQKIRLHFFDSETEVNLRSKWDRLAVHPGKPPIVEIEDGLIPRYTRAFIARSKELSCVFDSENNPVPASTRYRGPGEAVDHVGAEPIDFGGAIRDQRSAYFLGANARHYGHFLVESFSRAWAWDEARHQVAIVLAPPILEFARSLCAYIPGLAEGLEVIEGTTRFRRVTVASPAFSISRESYFEFKAMCERIAEDAVPAPRPVTEQPVYLSRARLEPNSNRTLIGEMRVERMLEAEGFRIVHPETLPIAEQIAVVNTHKWIVAPMGSACHTRLFSRIENNLLMFTSDHVHNNYVLCDALTAGATHYANVFRSPIRRDHIPTSLKPVTLDDERLLHVLKDMGLIRSGARLDPPPTELNDELKRSIRRARRRASRRARPREKKLAGDNG